MADHDRNGLIRYALRTFRLARPTSLRCSWMRAGTIARRHAMDLMSAAAVDWDHPEVARRATQVPCAAIRPARRLSSRASGRREDGLSVPLVGSPRPALQGCLPTGAWPDGRGTPRPNPWMPGNTLQTSAWHCRSNSQSPAAQGRARKVRSVWAVGFAWPPKVWLHPSASALPRPSYVGGSQRKWLFSKENCRHSPPPSRMPCPSPLPARPYAPVGR